MDVVDQVMEIFGEWFPDIVRLAQLIAAGFTVTVWFKLKEIERRFLFKSQHRVWSKQLTKLAIDLRKNASDIDGQQADIYRNLAEAEVIVATVKRAKLAELALQIIDCNQALSKGYESRFLILKGGRKAPSADELWKINAALHGLSTAVMTLGKELNWKS